jgi:mannose-6-phosphate isomerase-like protein (cupin superfamily)
MSVVPTERVGTHLMFENDRVRVWDLALAPQEWLESHIHRDDFLFIVVDGGHLRHASPDNPPDAHEVKYQTDQVVFIEVGGETLHHRLTNIGDAPYRNFVIELKS